MKNRFLAVPMALAAMLAIPATAMAELPPLPTPPPLPEEVGQQIVGVVPPAPAFDTQGSSGLEAIGQYPDTPATPPPAVHHDGAPEPVAFTSDQVLRLYLSDLPSTGLAYQAVIDQFGDLRQNHPDVMDQNMVTVKRINHEATPQQVDCALADAHDDLLVTMSDALGPTLGGHFRQALAEHRLPKTAQLFSGNLARGGGIASSTFAEKYLNNKRPNVVDPEGIMHYHREGAKDEYETSPSFPSGHTNQATWKSTLLAYILPEVGPQLVARGAEVGFNRQVIGVHYPLDVIGGRMTGTAASVDRLDDSKFKALLGEASKEVHAELEWRCGGSIADCAARDLPSTQQAVSQATERMTYDFRQVGPTDAPFVVPAGAGKLLETRFPQLTYPQLEEVFRQTAIPSGYPLDKQGGAPSWQRLNLAAALASHPVVNPDGSITL